jgi:hypothetical protein
MKATLALAALLLLSGLGAPPARAADAPPLSDTDQQCLACHGQEGLSKSFPKGDALSLHVPPEAFARSVHAPLGCGGCHADVDLARHSANPKSYESARAMAVAGMQTCRGCHGSIFDAYAKSVHGKDTSGAAPICAGCHSAHGVTRAAVGTHLRDNCVGCHAGVLATHEKWLPNTKRHLDSVACAACHAPGAERRLELRLRDASLNAEPSGKEAIAERPLDGNDLAAILRGINSESRGRVTLVGRLEARTPEESHGLAHTDRALRDCAACHRKGAEPFRNVTLSLIGPDGKRARHEVKSDVLHGVATIDSMRAFYAPGGTRVQALDILLALAVGGGILAPLGHLVMRKLLRRKDKQ